jgi:asparagine synthase (glutamine-hydrolysing)
MCGIAGYISRRPPDPQIIQRMMDRIAHRGPDGSGVWNGEKNGWHITLGHRRLAIIDLEGGKQPLSNEDGSVWITYNGEVYNYNPLKIELEKLGHRFATRCDTETIVHHYEQFGPDRLSDLDGMFAFAIWDNNRGELLLARDRVGIKPLYFASLPDGGIAFASELLALAAHPDVDRTIDTEGLASYFFCDYAHPPQTLIKGARKLQPRHYLKWTPQGLSKPQPFPQRAIESVNQNDLIEQLIGKLDAAVESQLMSDVPLGVFLSGGIDSSLMTALAQKHVMQPLTTFSIGFDDPQFDESGYAEHVASHIGTRHVKQNFSEKSLIDLLDESLDCLDEPIGDPSILPTYAVSKLAAAHVKVVLGGDGGDELWAGYPTYKAHRAAQYFAHVPEMIRQNLIAPLVAKLPVQSGYQRFDWKAKRFFLRWDDDPALRHLRWMSNVDLPDLRRALPTAGVLPSGLSKTLESFAGNGDLNSILALDFLTYLPGSVLTKVDRASMAHGLEVRPPMLADALVDFAFSLPASVKLHGSTSKMLLKQAAARLLPERIINRRKKGFAIPLARWLKGPLHDRLRDVIYDSPIWQIGLLDRPTFASWLQEHENDQVDRSKPLWATLVLDHWHRRLQAVSLK